MSRLALLGLVVAATTGCTNVTMEDDVDLDLDWTPLVGPSNDLHTPYVEGASFGVYAESHTSREKMTGWTIAARDPSILSCKMAVVTSQQGKDDEGEIFAACTATSAGSTELEVRDDGGQTQLSRTVEVKVPDRAAVLAHGPLLLGQDESAAVATSAQVLQGGTATFLVKWYSGSDLLHGNGALEVAPPQGIDGRALQTSFLEDRDWLQVTANASGPVALSAHGHPVATFPVSMVLPTDIARLKLSGMDESQAQKDEWLTVWAQTFDKGGASIYGVDFTWDLEGQTQVGMGDLYRYPYKPGMTKSLGASAPNGMNVSATIHGGQGYVDSTNNIGCSIGGRGRAGGLASLAALLLFGLALRRRG